MAVKEDLIELIKSRREEGFFSTYLEDQVLNAFAGKHGLNTQGTSDGSEKYDLSRIEELIKGEYEYQADVDEFGHQRAKFTPVAVQELTRDDIDKAVKELEQISPRHDVASYPPQNVGAVTEWKYFTGKYSLFAKGYFQAWQGKWLVFIKDYGWCQDIECKVHHDHTKSEIEPYHDVPRQILLRHE